jgi:predicted PurR-regulated permease PerM
MNVATTSLVVLAVAAATGLLYWAQPVFIPIVLSVLIGYALEPVVRWLTLIRVPRMAGAALVVMTLVGTLGWSGYSLSDDAGAVVAQLPDAVSKLRRIVRREPGEESAITQVQKAAEELQRTADETAQNPVPRGVQRVQIEEPAIDIRNYVVWGSTNAVAFASQATLVVFFVFFLLASGDLFKRKLVRLARSTERRQLTLQILDEINVHIERYLRVLVITSAIVGIATWIAFETVGLEQAVLWAILAGVFNSVPYFGPVIVTGGTAIVAFLQFGTISMALTVAGVALAITTLEGWLLVPLLTSRAVETNEIAVFVSLIFWSFVWGVWGTLLAVPMLVVAKACCDRIDRLKPVGELLGT